MAKIETTCAFCNAPLTLVRYKGNFSERYFCDRQCKNKYRTAIGYVDVVCEACGKARRKTQSHAAKCQHHFCSRKCAAIWKSKQPSTEKLIETICDFCRREIKIKPYKMNRSHRHFCSVDCRSKYHSKYVIGDINPTYRRVASACSYCGASIQVIPYRAQQFQHLFCDKNCRGKWTAENVVGPAHHNWTGGYQEYYGPNWPTQRKAARTRDKRRCQACGITESKLKRELDVHHIQPFRTFEYIPDENERYKDANQLTNLISLCPSCHQRVEHGKVPIQLMLV